MGSPEGLHNQAVRPPRGYGGGVLTNRSAPDARVAPVLIVADVRAAVACYTEVLGFVEHVRIGEGHRAQLGLPDGPAAELVVAEERPGRAASRILTAGPTRSSSRPSMSTPSSRPRYPAEPSWWTRRTTGSTASARPR